MVRIDLVNLETQNLIVKLYTEFKLGSVIIAKKCPDFVNEDKKLAVEVFYRRHKEQFRLGGLKSWMKERENLFKANGWRTLFFDETQVNQQNILQIEV